LDLERRVAATREQGVQVTKEVQLAAQRVTRENAKLRDLLRKTGYTDDVIDVWVKQDGCLLGAEHPQLVVKSPSEKAPRNVTIACASQRGTKPDARDSSKMEASKVEMKTFKDENYPTVSALHDSGSANLRAVSPTHAFATKNCSQESQLHVNARAPCKLVTLLAENPAADITQVSLSAGTQTNNHEDQSADGVECSAAYSMLMRHATSGESMDRIAAALEGGCTPSATGGCSVKKSVVWRTLDEECT
jgi:hypothetical protein